MAAALDAPAARNLDAEPGPFGGELLLWALPPRYRTFRLGSDVTYVDDVLGPIRAPAGSVTDFASIPRALWWLLPPAGFYGPAAIIHDYMYRTGQTAGGHWRRSVTRREADAAFLRAMCYLARSLQAEERRHVPPTRLRRCGHAVRVRAAPPARWLTRYAMWAAVRCFGWGSFLAGPRDVPLASTEGADIARRLLAIAILSAAVVLGILAFGR